MNCVRSLLATGQQAQAVTVLTGALAVMADGLGADAPNTVRARQLLQDIQAPAYRLPPWRGSEFFVSGIR